MYLGLHTKDLATALLPCLTKPVLQSYTTCDPKSYQEPGCSCTL